jgi:hypothetical protein
MRGRCHDRAEPSVPVVDVGGSHVKVRTSGEANGFRADDRRGALEPPTWVRAGNADK